MSKAIALNRPANGRPGAAAAMILALSACGGGGGGGGHVSSTPPPTVPPAPIYLISAPARATVGPGTAPVFATSATPNFTTGPAAGTTFPLLQTALIIDEASVKPHESVNSAGGTATVVSGTLNVSFDGAPDLWGDSSLDWTRYGYWSNDWESTYFGREHGVFVAGYETPAGSMPTTGSATYTGTAQGAMYSGGFDAVPVMGDASFTANFGARTVSGELTNMWRVWWDETAWNDVSFTSTIAGNRFSGTTSVTTAPELGMRSNATGTVEGKFFGPSAQEAGAVWTLYDGTNAAIGTLAGKRD